VGLTLKELPYGSTAPKSAEALLETRLPYLDAGLTLRLGDAGAGRINAGGAVTLTGGTLAVNFKSGVAPSVGDTLSVLKGSSLRGKFLFMMVPSSATNWMAQNNFLVFVSDSTPAGARSMWPRGVRACAA